MRKRVAIGGIARLKHKDAEFIIKDRKKKKKKHKLISCKTIWSYVWSLDGPFPHPRPIPPYLGRENRPAPRGLIAHDSKLQGPPVVGIAYKYQCRSHIPEVSLLPTSNCIVCWV